MDGLFLLAERVEDSGVPFYGWNPFVQENSKA